MPSIKYVYYLTFQVIHYFHAGNRALGSILGNVPVVTCGRWDRYLWEDVGMLV